MVDPKIYSIIKNSFRLNLSASKELLKQGYSLDFSTLELIYDMQAGSYTQLAKLNKSFMHSFTDEIVDVLKDFVSPTDALLDCGTGEGTTLDLIIKKLNLINVLAIDASWSRLSFALENTSANQNMIKYAVADMAHLPLKSNSIDVVLTVHALEPNGGRELKLLSELARVSSKFLVLVEPDYEDSSKYQKARMQSLGYINSLEPYFESAGLDCVLKKKVFNNANSLNVASIFVLRKLEKTQDQVFPDWVCPSNRDLLENFGSGLISKMGLFYPILGAIPFLRRQDAKYVTNPNPAIKF
jgi:ubiquinone/menaquinone biosynthesis C-methylase UbiE